MQRVYYAIESQFGIQRINIEKVKISAFEPLLVFENKRGGTNNLRGKVYPPTLLPRPVVNYVSLIPLVATPRAIREDITNSTPPSNSVRSNFPSFLFQLNDAFSSTNFPPINYLSPRSTRQFFNYLAAERIESRDF